MDRAGLFPLLAQWKVLTLSSIAKMYPFLNKISLTVVDQWDSVVKDVMELGHTKPLRMLLTLESQQNLNTHIRQGMEHADKTSMLNISFKVILKSFMEI